MEDAYYEEQMGVLIDNMLLQVHILGNGVVGRAAFAKTHQWMFSDANSGGQNPVRSLENQHRFQIPERMEFVDQTKRLFREIEYCGTFTLPENVPSSSNSEIYSPSGIFAALISSGNSFNGHQKPMHGASPGNHIRTTTCTGTWSSGHSSLPSIEQQLPSQTRLLGSENVSPANPTNLSKSCQLDNYSPWIGPSPEQNNKTLATPLSENPSQAMEVSSVTFSVNGAEFLGNTPVNHSSNSVQSSMVNAFTSDGDRMFLNDSYLENDWFDGFGVDLECLQAKDFLDDILAPVLSGNHLDCSAEMAECISEQRLGSTVGSQKTLFSKLGLEQFLDGVAGSSSSIASSSFADELSSTSKTKMGSCSVSGDQVQLASLPCSVGNRLHNLEPKKDTVLKSEVGSLIGDGYSFSCGSSIVSQDSQPKMPEKYGKISRKRARPGSRPKPKDRQQIQDRIAELRKLIPNGVKMSIDSLLAQTIKHMLFLQSVTNHAEKVKQAEERKICMIDDQMVLNDFSCSSSYNAMWAFEVGAQIIVDPVDVKDLRLPGQKLIQMLCEEKGFFLEIVDVIQGFGLTILKGVMELRENKIWACFIVEAEVNIGS
ncbi:hypothetical protein U1Q18_021072 [Sarracenia purpurea var. burkii]